MNILINGMLILFYFFGFYIFIYNIHENYLFLKNEDLNDIKEEKNEDVKEVVTEDKDNLKTVEVPYEEKYLVKLRNMINEYVFSEEELKKEEEKFFELVEMERSNLTNSILEIKNGIQELHNKLNNLKEQDMDNDNHEIKRNKDEQLIQKLEDNIKNDITNYVLKLKELEDTKLNEEELKKKARQFIIDEQLKKYKICFVVERTPLGNVLMVYNHEKLAFEYYSDVTIPYRFLETVARKYVITYNYRPLYIDMEEELKNYEKKLEEIESANKEAQEKIEETKKINNANEDKENNKKNVFAKFKNYNKEAGTGKVNTAPPPKNSIPQNRLPTVNINNENKQEKLLLKERSNRYSYQGKFSNFNILQKIDRKKVDKKYALTFAEFKKLQMNNKI